MTAKRKVVNSMLVENYVGVSIASVSDEIGILRSFVLDAEIVLNGDFIKSAQQFYTNYFADDVFVGVEDVFHVTIPTDVSSRPIYGKSYIEPLEKISNDHILNNSEISEITDSRKDDNIIVSLLYYSETLKVAVTCFTPIDVSLLKGIKKRGSIVAKEFESNDFKSKFVNFEFDEIYPDDLNLYGVEAIYSFEKRMFGDWLQTVVLSKNDISRQEINDMVLTDQEIVDSALECQEWIQSVKTI